MKGQEPRRSISKIGASVVLLPLTPNGFPVNNQHSPDILGIALVKVVALRLRGIETLQRLNSDLRLVLLKLSPLMGDRPNPIKTITNWKRVSVALEKIDIFALSDISDDIVLTDEINYAIGSLTTHVTSG
ncbi:hypothetical protein EVAR_3754_1 [Eumeta japonica]|uniref:Uncharacterized protein n=1 Tax=Eumeta variegata TaxID=151549 RepID=A0A4C1SUY3_EUMVA|nr:hypothetical protein EVAR_3754_1 [Eumeta japonica]